MGMFERRHYEAIAEVLNNCFVWHMNGAEVKFTAHELANKFQKDNPNFEREKFLKACGMEEG